MRFPLVGWLVSLCSLGWVSGFSALAAGESTATPITSPTPRFEDEIVAFEKADATAMPAPGAVLFTGSSSIRLWATLAADFPEIRVLNRGFGGSQMADSARLFDRVTLPYRPRMIVLYAGTNDIADGKSPAQVLADFAAYVNKVHAALPGTRVVFVSANPSVARWNLEDKMLELNRLAAEFIRGNDGKKGELSYIDTHAALLGADGQPRPEILEPDGLHLNAAGYAIWQDLLRPKILQWAAAENGKP